MTFSTSQLQQLRVILSAEIEVQESNRRLVRTKANKAVADLAAGVFEPGIEEIVRETLISLRKESRKIGEKVVRMGDLQKHVKTEIAVSIAHDRRIQTQQVQVEVVITKGPLGLVTDMALVNNVIALTDLDVAQQQDDLDTRQSA